MRKLILLGTLLCAMVLSISASPSRAQNVLWVFSAGNDANPCTQANPCATFQGAISKGSVSQINCINSGSYGPFTITASITIDCGTGNVGNVVVSGAGNNAITINTAGAATIVLRHLSLNGLGSATNGIGTTLFASGALIVEDCTVQGFANGYGLLFIPGSARGLLQVSNSQFSKNEYGIVVSPSGGQIASVILNRVEVVGNSIAGLFMGGSVVAGTMRDSVVGGNGAIGVLAQANQVYFTVEESSIVANLIYGIQTNSAGSSLKVAASTIGGNGTGVLATLGSLVSFGDNHVSDNGSDGTFTSTKALK